MLAGVGYPVDTWFRNPIPNHRPWMFLKRDFNYLSLNWWVYRIYEPSTVSPGQKTYIGHTNDGWAGFWIRWPSKVRTDSKLEVLQALFYWDWSPSCDFLWGKCGQLLLILTRWLTKRPCNTGKWMICNWHTGIEVYLSGYPYNGMCFTWKGHIKPPPKKIHSSRPLAEKKTSTKLHRRESHSPPAIFCVASGKRRRGT